MQLHITQWLQQMGLYCLVSSRWVLGKGKLLRCKYLKMTTKFLQNGVHIKVFTTQCSCVQNMVSTIPIPQRKESTTQCPQQGEQKRWCPFQGFHTRVFTLWCPQLIVHIQEFPQYGINMVFITMWAVYLRVSALGVHKNGVHSWVSTKWCPLYGVHNKMLSTSGCPNQGVRHKVASVS